MSRRCVFLDRDGVINEKAAPHEYIRQWSEFRFLPNVSDWIRIFNALDYLVIVITNQRGIARGKMTRQAVDEIHRRMIEELDEHGARVDDVFLCPHEEGTCDCRKPKPGMLLQAQAKWDIDFSASLLIGDSDEDEAVASACGVRFLRVRDGRII
ncbi:MAG: HAD family hydrolase [Acidobacteriia bacterium]|nr:HAD family hydrolase [Terriglobia bacterium]